MPEDGALIVYGAIIVRETRVEHLVGPDSMVIGHPLAAGLVERVTKTIRFSRFCGNQYID